MLGSAGDDARASLNDHRADVAIVAAEAVHAARYSGQTADPGFIAHWTFTQNLSEESISLAYGVVQRALLTDGTEAQTV